MGKVIHMSKAGKLDLDNMRKSINKKTGMKVAHDLTKENPTAVKQWISTGLWLYRQPLYR